METSEAYRAVRERMIEIARATDPSTPLPACPEWTVRELLAHVTGVAADVTAGRLDGAGTDPWVEAQVAARAERTAEEIVAEWQEIGPQVDEICVALGDGMSQLVFDTVSHEQDLRGGIGQPGGHDGALEIALRWLSDTWASAPVPSGALRITAGPVEVTRGDGPPTATMTAAPFEALRALSGRRSADQIRGYDWDGDPEPWITRFSVGPFAPRSSPLVEG